MATPPKGGPPMRRGSAPADDDETPELGQDGISVGPDATSKCVSTMRKYRSQTLKDYQIMIEYKHLKHHAPRGMYVLPSFTDRRTWHGVVFLRQGLYKRGIFKFVVQMPECYPEDGARPSVRFLSHVFHPMVDPETGTLDLETKFPTWKTGEHYIVLVLNWVKKIFYLKDFSCPRPLNEEAADLIKNDRDGFLRKLDDCVNLSISQRLTPAEDSPIMFTHYKKQHDVIRSRILRLDKKRGGSGEPPPEAAAADGTSGAVAEGGEDNAAGGGGSDSVLQAAAAAAVAGVPPGPPPKAKGGKKAGRKAKGERQMTSI